MSTKPTSLSPEQLLTQQMERWQSCGPNEGEDSTQTLLRLATLRDFARDLHAFKSTCLARGNKAEVQKIKSWEERLEKLKNAQTLPDDLKVWISGQETLKNKTRIIPHGLYEVLGNEKLDRYDRQWEKVIAAEACSKKWMTWGLEAWVRVEQVEEFNQRVQQEIWPIGVLLFVESIGTPQIPPLSSEPMSWFGKWICVLHPQFSTPLQLDGQFPVSSWPGFAPERSFSPQWKLIFAPKRPLG